MAKIVIEKFVRHKTANWDGVIYQTEDGKRRVSTKYMDWELTPEREAQVEENPDFDLVGFVAHLEHISEEGQFTFGIMSVNPFLLTPLKEMLVSKMGKEAAEKAISVKIKEIVEGENQKL